MGERRRRRRSDDTTGEIILYGGMVILTYYVLKSWGVIQPMTLSRTTQSMNTSEWIPLSKQELNNIRE